MKFEELSVSEDHEPLLLKSSECYSFCPKMVPACVLERVLHLLLAGLMSGTFLIVDLRAAANVCRIRERAAGNQGSHVSSSQNLQVRVGCSDGIHEFEMKAVSFLFYYYY